MYISPKGRVLPCMALGGTAMTADTACSVAADAVHVHVEKQALIISALTKNAAGSSWIGGMIKQWN